MIHNIAVLLLNMSYEPLGIINGCRAICLEVRDKVHVEEYHPTHIARTVSDTWRVPSVVRLKHYENIRQKKRNSATRKSKILLRDKHRCGYCNRRCTNSNATLDHIIPKSKGGQNIPGNLVTCCQRCNQYKGNRTPEEAGMVLRKSVKDLNIDFQYVINQDRIEKNPSWAKYMYFESTGDGRYTESD